MTEVNVLTERPQPRLSILHLMAWTLGAALMLIFYNHRHNLFFDYGIENPRSAIIDSTFVMKSIFQGAGLAFIGLLILRKIRRGASVLTEPGHWMLMTSGVTACLPMIDYGIRYGTDVVYSGYMWTIGLRIVTSVVIVILGLLAICSKRCVRFWTAFFVFKIVAAVYSSVSVFLVRVLAPTFFMLPSMILHWGPLLLLIAAVVDDQRRKTHRDWLHGAGVLLGVGSIIVDTLLGIAIWLSVNSLV